ncbi:Cytochrome P450 E-class group I protein [Dioscorea alata]|uniref:Cytochrome P450 E-class group I protein n=1 Tax=Dioscorea alata TaxID=55571 RepID=A0ACB7WW47_DIOAL|nr:Cytochrome P450 E-class group I protein [Dioscorea alata]
MMVFLYLFIFIISTLFFSYTLFFKTFNNGGLPPGPPLVPIIGNIHWFWTSSETFPKRLRDLHARYGPIITLHIGSLRVIFISDRQITYDALVTRGAVFADRPPAIPTTGVFTSNQHTINSAHYGPLWRLLRRNLISEILHSSRVKLFSNGRQWVLNCKSFREAKVVEQKKQWRKEPTLKPDVQFCLYNHYWTCNKKILQKGISN